MKKTIITTMMMAFAASTAQAQLFDNVGAGNANSNANNNTNQAQMMTNATDGADLIHYMRESKDIEADFKQITYNQRGEEVSEGHMWLSKPGKFFWDYQTPYQQQIISDGQNVYHYDMDLEQITVRSKDELVGDVAIRLLEGQESLNDEFDIEQVTGNNIPPFINATSGATVYSLIPKDENTEYNGAWVVFENNQLAQVLVDGGTGQQTIMTFSNLKRNHGIAASKFDFTPPAGVDVVGNIN